MSDIVELQSPDGDHATIQLHGKWIIMRILCAVHHVKELLRHHLLFCCSSEIFVGERTSCEGKENSASPKFRMKKKKRTIPLQSNQRIPDLSGKLPN